jgi:hypothetical protein
MRHEAHAENDRREWAGARERWQRTHYESAPKVRAVVLERTARRRARSARRLAKTTSFNHRNKSIIKS